MHDTEEMIGKLKRRAGMYIGKQNTSVEELYIFLNGYYMGKSSANQIMALDEIFYRKFTFYVFNWLEIHKKLICGDVGSEWYRPLDTFEDGITLFYSLCERFFAEYHSNSLE